jgi:hypothetical protein
MMSDSRERYERSIAEMKPTRFQDASEIFAGAVQSFRESLSDPERSAFREFENPQMMVREIEDHCKKYYQNRKLLGFCRRIQRFANAWEPFFEITNIFVSTNPEWAGISWGAIRMVFVVRIITQASLSSLVLIAY